MSETVKLRKAASPLRSSILGRAACLGLLLLLVLSAACQRSLEPTILLISLDGFRWDYLDRGSSPVLEELAAEGIRARGLIPVFPSKTFPNHYSIVTGLYPEQHGIIANNMYDPEFDETFSLSKREEVGNGRWWGGEPIWVTAGKQGLPTATLFWPGSEAEIQGRRPDFWKLYDDEMPYRDRVDQMLAWLDLPTSQRPRFICGYFSATDDAAHEWGPEDPRVQDAIAQVDEAIGWLMEGLQERGIKDEVDVILVSDHGMVRWTPERVILLDDHIDLSRVRVVDWDPVAQILPDGDYLEEAVRRLQGAHPSLQTYRREQMPERFHFSQNRRIPPIIAMADPGWKITSRASIEARPLPQHGGGSHGYDNMAEEMQGIFLARGPSFRKGEIVEPFLNIHIYPLMADILGIEAAPSAGDLARVSQMLSRR